MNKIRFKEGTSNSLLIWDVRMKSFIQFQECMRLSAFPASKVII